MAFTASENIQIGIPSTVSTTVESSSGWDSNFPVTKLREQQPADRAQTTNGASGIKSFVLDYGANVSGSDYSFAMLAFHNGTSGGTWRIRRNTSLPVPTTPVYDSTTMSLHHTALSADLSRGKRHSWKEINDADSFRYEQIDIDDDDAVTADGFFHAGRYITGELLTFTTGGRRVGSELAGFVDRSPRVTLPGGQVILSGSHVSRKVANFTLLYEGKTEVLNEIYKLQHLVGSHRDVGLHMTPDDTTYGHVGLYCGVLTPGPISQPVYNAYQLPLTITELA